MIDVKLAKIEIEKFRGIPNYMSIDFIMEGKPESALIFGDNGSGKSSLIDAIEFVTHGSIQSNQSGKVGDWLYSSISLNTVGKARVKVCLNDGREYESLMIRDEDAKCIKKHGDGVIEEFRRAPYILRRQDILKFWELPNNQKLKIFFKYIVVNTSSMLMADDEQLKIVSEERLRLKEQKRELIHMLSNYYSFDSKEMSNKNKGDFFGVIRSLNKGKTLKQLDSTHAQYSNLHSLNNIYDKILEANKEYKRIVRSSESLDAVDSQNSPLKEELQKIMLLIAPLVTDAFKKISRTNDYVKEINILVASKTEVSLEFMVILENGMEIEPIHLFSEANRDLLALLIYLEFVFYAGMHGQAKLLIFDDVFQSVDSTIRFRVMQYELDVLQIGKL